MPEHIARKSLSHRHLHRIEPKFATMGYCCAARQEPASGRPSPISRPILAKIWTFLLRITTRHSEGQFGTNSGRPWDANSIILGVRKAKPPCAFPPPRYLKTTHGVPATPLRLLRCEVLEPRQLLTVGFGEGEADYVGPEPDVGGARRRKRCCSPPALIRRRHSASSLRTRIIRRWPKSRYRRRRCSPWR